MVASELRHTHRCSTTSCATSDEDFANMATYPFQCVMWQLNTPTGNGLSAIRCQAIHISVGAQPSAGTVLATKLDMFLTILAAWLWFTITLRPPDDVISKWPTRFREIARRFEYWNTVFHELSSPVMCFPALISKMSLLNNFRCGQKMVKTQSVC